MILTNVYERVVFILECDQVHSLLRRLHDADYLVLGHVLGLLCLLCS
jgi:hypothetical protein